MKLYIDRYADHHDRISHSQVVVPLSPNRTGQQEVKVRFVLQVQPGRESCVVEGVDPGLVKSAGVNNIVSFIEDSTRRHATPFPLSESRKIRISSSCTHRDDTAHGERKKEVKRRVGLKIRKRVPQSYTQHVSAPLIFSTTRRRLIRGRNYSTILYLNKCIAESSCSTIDRCILKSSFVYLLSQVYQACLLTSLFLAL